MRERTVYKWRIYSRDPDSKYHQKRYFARKQYDHTIKKYKWEYLHRFVWEAHNGKIPPGFAVIHKNGDISDNRIENLDCIPVVTHLHNIRKNRL